MKIQTANFATAIAPDIIPVSIARYEPRYRKTTQGYLRKYKSLAPPALLLSKYKRRAISEKVYAERFQIEVLRWLSVQNVLSDLAEFGDDLVLLCYCAKSAFCHRHLVADWINQSGLLDVAVTEYKTNQTAGQNGYLEGIV